MDETLNVTLMINLWTLMMRAQGPQRDCKTKENNVNNGGDNCMDAEEHEIVKVKLRINEIVWEKTLFAFKMNICTIV